MPTEPRAKVIFLMGPTASGKTEFALYLAERLPIDIISVDSAMVYRDMDIGTAKPTEQERARVSHRLIDILDPSESYSAGRFRSDAIREIDEVLARDRIPILVGGTMLYFRALAQGWADLPTADKKVRQRLDDEALQLGWPALHQRLAKVDAEAAKRIHSNDSQRIQRALEVYELTQTPLSQWQEQSSEPCPYDLIKIALAPSERSQLHALIAKRLERMMERGFLQEVEKLYARGDLTPKMPSIRAVGYRQLWNFIDGQIELDVAKDQALTATRQLAKRQMTWLRSERDLTWITEHSSAERWHVLRNLLSRLDT